MDVIIGIIALAVGMILGWLMRGFQLISKYGGNPEEVHQMKESLKKSELETEKLQERALRLQEDKSHFEEKLTAATQRNEQLSTINATLEADFKNLEKKLAEQKAEIAEMHQRMTEQFKNLANEILDEKSKKFTDQNKTQIGQILTPLGEKIKEFEKKVEETYDKEARDKTSLQEQIKQLSELNKKMTEEAGNLTRALKGDSKTQGNWGEVVLERILERSGLTKGQEYETQFSAKNEEGSQLRPDVVIHLPDEKYLVIDAKVSLTAYERFVSSQDSGEQEMILKQHIASVKAHVKSLSGKRYADLFDTSPDFVLMFIPIEPAFGLAVMHDPQIYHEAFEKGIVIVSPSTLLATMATIRNIWKYEYQNQNAQKIADEGAKLYDKFVAFVDDLENIGNRIDKVKESHDLAMNKLSTGRGNLIGRAEKMKALGLSTKKRISEKLLDTTDKERDFTEEFK